MAKSILNSGLQNTSEYETTLQWPAEHLSAWNKLLTARPWCVYYIVHYIKILVLQAKNKEKRCWLKQSKKGAVGCLWYSEQIIPCKLQEKQEWRKQQRYASITKIQIDLGTLKFGNMCLFCVSLLPALQQELCQHRTRPLGVNIILLCVYIYMVSFFCKYCGSGRLKPLWPMLCSVLSCYCCWKSSWWLFCMKASVISFWGIKSVTMQWFLHTKREKQESCHDFFKSIDGIISCISNCISNWCFSICMLTCNILTI